MPYRCIIISSRSDDEIEVFIPSDTEADDTAFQPATYKKVEEGEELVMTSARVSTKCPITQQVMRRPVRNNHCGHYYDSCGVEQLIKNSSNKKKNKGIVRCPVQGCPNSHTLLMDDMTFDEEMLKYIQKNTS